jgi:hypothetical protein
VGAEEMGSLCKVSFCRVERMPLNSTLKMVKMVNFMLCIFYPKIKGTSPDPQKLPASFQPVLTPATF